MSKKVWDFMPICINCGEHYQYEIATIDEYHNRLIVSCKQCDRMLADDYDTQWMDDDGKWHKYEMNMLLLMRMINRVVDALNFTWQQLREVAPSEERKQGE